MQDWQIEVTILKEKMNAFENSHKQSMSEIHKLFEVINGKLNEYDLSRAKRDGIFTATKTIFSAAWLVVLSVVGGISWIITHWNEWFHK